MFVVTTLVFALDLAGAYENYNNEAKFYKTVNQLSTEKTDIPADTYDDDEVSKHLIEKLYYLQNKAKEIDDDTEINPNLLPYLQHQDNDKIKQKMDAFTMTRKATHFKLPGNDDDVKYSRHYDVNSGVEPIAQGKVKYRKYKDHDAGVAPVPRGTEYAENIIKSLNDETIHSEEVRVVLSKVFNKQSQLLEKLHSYLGYDNPAQRAGKDFDQLLLEIETKRNTTTTVDVQLFGATAKAPIPVVKTVIDETEVKKALINDPYVQRILSMNRRRRLKYEEQYRKYRQALERHKFANPDDLYKK